MSHSYYQSSGAPGWGTTQFQFGAPPVPSFQPQPSWSGLDYYRAHAINSDPSLFDNAWNRVRDYDMDPGGLGVGINEARHWHRRVYGGMGDLRSMFPAELGHAAAYEAYRMRIHNTSLFQPLSGDMERQRQALVGVAIGEVTRLLRDFPQFMDMRSQQIAGEAAAATASNLFYWSRDHDDDNRGRSRHGSVAGSYDSYDDPYAYDTRAMYPRGRSRSRSRSQYGYANSGMPGSVYPSQTSSIPIPGAATTIVPGGYGSSYGNTGSYGVAGYPASYSGGPGMPASYGGSQYGTAMQPYQMNAHYGSGVPMVMGRQRSHSMSIPYTQTQYVNAAGGFIPPGQQPQAIILRTHPHKHRKHHSKHRSKRSRSSSRY